MQGRDHVGAELGIVGVALGVAGDEAQLADQILDVVHDEGEAAVELVEALRVGERLLAARLGEIARRLDAGGAEQVEILPVERPPDERMLEDDEADEPVAVDQRHAGPGAVERGQPGRDREPRLARRRSQPARSRVEIEDVAALLRGSGCSASASVAGLGQVVAPVPARRRRLSRHCSSASSSRPAGALGDVGERLDDPLLERRRRRRATDRVG